MDSSALALMINPSGNPPNDPETGRPVEYAQERIEGFVKTLAASDALVIPTPVLAEILVKAEDAAPEFLEKIAGLARLRVRPFGPREAIEVAMMTREAQQAGDKRGGSEQPWQKIKYDRQVIATARAMGADMIYSDDRGLADFARLLAIKVISTWELPVPASATNLFTTAGLRPDGQPAPEV